MAPDYHLATRYRLYPTEAELLRKLTESQSVHSDLRAAWEEYRGTCPIPHNDGQRTILTHERPRE